MRIERITFLTKNEIDIQNIINVLKNDTQNRDAADRSILEKLIVDFTKGDLSLLTNQEIQFLKLNPKNTWADYLIYRIKFISYEKQESIADFPLYLVLEPVSACNLRCTMCFQIDETFTNNQKFMGMMDFNLLKKIIDEAEKNGTKAITLTCRGEPTLHPRLGEMLEYCGGKFLELKINTNATKLTDKLIHQMLKSGLTDIVFSVDSYTKEEYESIRVRGIFEQVLNNIIRFKEIREKSYPNSRCATRISGVKVDPNQDPEKFKEFWKEYVDYVIMVDMIQRWDIYNNTADVMGNGPCYHLAGRMYIYFDGACNPCDQDYKGLLAIGNVKDKTIREIWKSKKYADLRDAHRNNLRANYNPCDRCPVGS